MALSLCQWIDGDESATEMLARVLNERLSLFVQPLHGVPLRVGNVLELVGPSGSTKTQNLKQAAVNCIIPTEWNRVRYGRLECSLVFLDLDRRLDISRLSEVLKLRISEADGNDSRSWNSGCSSIFPCKSISFLHSLYEVRLEVKGT